MVEWLALRAGSRLLLMPKAEAMELAPKPPGFIDLMKSSWSFPFPLPSTSSPGPSGPAEGSAVASSAAALAPHAAGVQQFSFALLHP